VRGGSAACSAVSSASRFVTASYKTSFWSSAAAAAAGADGVVVVGGGVGGLVLSLLVPLLGLFGLLAGATAPLGVSGFPTAGLPSALVLGVTPERASQLSLLSREKNKNKKGAACPPTYILGRPLIPLTAQTQTRASLGRQARLRAPPRRWYTGRSSLAHWPTCRARRPGCHGRRWLRARRHHCGIASARYARGSVRSPS